MLVFIERVCLAGLFVAFVGVAASGTSALATDAASRRMAPAPDPAARTDSAAVGAVSTMRGSRLWEGAGDPSIGEPQLAADRTGAADSLDATVSGVWTTARDPASETRDSEPVSPTTAVATEPQDDAPRPQDDEDPPAAFVTDDGAEILPQRIRRFLEGREAPLAQYAEELVRAGVEHDVDPRIVVGIAVAESSGGAALPAGTHNAWGWSGDGPHGLEAWSSWPEAIDRFTERFGDLYDTSSVDESMARTYVPPNWRWWLETVNWVVGEI